MGTCLQWRLFTFRAPDPKLVAGLSYSRPTQMFQTCMSDFWWSVHHGNISAILAPWGLHNALIQIDLGLFEAWHKDYIHKRLQVRCFQWQGLPNILMHLVLWCWSFTSANEWLVMITNELGLVPRVCLDFDGLWCQLYFDYSWLLFVCICH